jgi:hypothetical protein
VSKVGAVFFPLFSVIDTMRGTTHQRTNHALLFVHVHDVRLVGRKISFISALGAYPL